MIKYSPLSDGDNVAQVKNKLTDEVQSMYVSHIAQPLESLFKSHSLVWENIWKSGFTISHSRAASAYNGDKINTTAYYALCFERSSQYEIEPNGNQFVLKNPTESPKNPGHCYAGHNTLQAASLWSNFRSVEEILRVTNLWKLTLMKQGCGR